jgi:hypothetical protein
LKLWKSPCNVGFPDDDYLRIGFSLQPTHRHYDSYTRFYLAQINEAFAFNRAVTSKNFELDEKGEVVVPRMLVIEFRSYGYIHFCICHGKYVLFPDWTTDLSLIRHLPRDKTYRSTYFITRDGHPVYVQRVICRDCLIHEGFSYTDFGNLIYRTVVEEFNIEQNRKKLNEFSVELLELQRRIDWLRLAAERL